jgi:hypothetical protein
VSLPHAHMLYEPKKRAVVRLEAKKKNVTQKRTGEGYKDAKMQREAPRHSPVSSNMLIEWVLASIM